MRLILSLCLIFSTTAFAEIIAKGSMVSDTQCSYFSTATGHFSITFTDDQFQTSWGDKVFIQYGFKNDFNGKAWSNPSDIEMISTGPYAWKTDFQETVQSRGEFSYGQLNFVIRIDHINGSNTYIKGSNSSYGYFMANLNNILCQIPDQLEDLTIQTVIAFN